MNDKKTLHKKIVPFTTPAGLQIGRAYQPKPTVSQAQCIEHYRAPSYGKAWWFAFVVVSAVAAFVIVRTA